MLKSKDIVKRETKFTLYFIIIPLKLLSDSDFRRRYLSSLFSKMVSVKI